MIAEGIAEYMDPNDPILRGRRRATSTATCGWPRCRSRACCARRWPSRSRARGVKVTIGEKDVGYELRCGYPTAFDRDYTRDLGVGAVKTLLGGRARAC